MVIGIIERIPQQIQDIHNIGFIYDGAKRTDLFASATFDAQLLIDISSVVYNGNGTLGADLTAFMTQTAAAGVAACSFFIFAI